MRCARDCDFGAENDNQIRDQVLTNYQSEYLQRKLSEEQGDLTLERTLEIAYDCERVEQRMTMLRVQSDAVSTINKVTSQPSKLQKKHHHKNPSAKKRETS